MILYRIVSADMHEAEFAPDIWGYQTDLKHCKARFMEEVVYLHRELKADKIWLAFSGDNNFRKAVDPKYKANRTKPKPVGYKAMIRWCEEVAGNEGPWIFVQRDTLEADDVMGLMADGHDGDVILVSGDKDMATVPCRCVDPQDPTLTERTYTEDEADWNWMLQTLTGDSTDGYKGCPKVGPVSGKKLLSGHTKLEDLWGAVVAAYEKNGAVEDDALRNARLARILRAGDWDAHGGVRLWGPKMLLTPF